MGVGVVGMFEPPQPKDITKIVVVKVVTFTGVISTPFYDFGFRKSVHQCE